MEKGKRKPNFSETEKLRLCEEYEKETGKFSSTVSTKEKHDACQRMIEEIHRTGADSLRSGKTCAQ